MSKSRKFAKISPERLWKSTLRGFTPHAKLLGVHLMTAPRYSMVGIYECPRYFMEKYTGLTEEESSVALDELISKDFCQYDDVTETVWVVDMAMTQVADGNLSPQQRVGVINELTRLHVESEYPFVDEFIARYKQRYPFLPCSVDELCYNHGG